MTALGRTSFDQTLAEHFTTNGWLLTRALDDLGTEDLRRWVTEVAAPTDRANDRVGAFVHSDDGVIHHYEMTNSGPCLARSENFVPVHAGLRKLLMTGPLLDTAAALLGEPAVLYKEKVNYKLAGGAGYSPHQDAPAYPFIDSHVSCMIAVDDATLDNGCLEVVAGAHHELLPTDDTGCIRPDVADALEWMPVEVRAGEVLWFHSLTPHRSGPNTSPADRRALYPTYNALSDGDLRQAYYAEKLARFADRSAAGQHSGVSLIGDFQGRPVV